jgi:hypothetical protein
MTPPVPQEPLLVPATQLAPERSSETFVSLVPTGLAPQSHLFAGLDHRQ